MMPVQFEVQFQFEPGPCRRYLRFVNDQQMATSIATELQPRSSTARDERSVLEPLNNWMRCASDLNLGNDSSALCSRKVLQPAKDDRRQELLSHHNFRLRLRRACHILGDASVGSALTLTDLVGGRPKINYITPSPSWSTSVLYLNYCQRRPAFLKA